MKQYLKFVFTVAFLVFSFGYALPLLISTPSTILVLLGLAYAALFIPYVVYIFNEPAIKFIISKFKGN